MPEAELFDAVRTGDLPRLDSLLAAAPALAEARDPSGVSALMTALYHRRPEAAARLRAHRAALDAHELAALGDAPALARLLEAEPGVARSRSADGFTALHFAAFLGGVACASLLLSYGADPDDEARNPMRVHPLHSAAAAGRLDVAALLIAAGADPDSTQQQDYTALFEAARAGNADLAEVLLAAGASRERRDAGGQRPCDLAAANGHAALAARLTPSA